MFYLHACLYTTYVQCLWRPEEGIKSPVPELETIVKYAMAVGAGNVTQALGKNSKCA